MAWTNPAKQSIDSVDCRSICRSIVKIERQTVGILLILSTSVQSIKVLQAADFCKNRCFLRSTDKTDNNQSWTGQHYSKLFLLFNNNNLFVGYANRYANYFLSAAPAASGVPATVSAWRLLIGCLRALVWENKHLRRLTASDLSYCSLQLYIRSFNLPRVEPHLIDKFGACP